MQFSRFLCILLSCSSIFSSIILNENVAFVKAATTDNTNPAYERLSSIAELTQEVDTEGVDMAASKEFSESQMKQKAKNAVFRKHALERSKNPDPDIELGPAAKFLDRMRTEHGRGVWSEKVGQSGKEMGWDGDGDGNDDGNGGGNWLCRRH